MTSTKRPRGRPRGSGIDDTAALARVAGLLARDSSLKTATAMRRVICTRPDWGATDSALLRRWQAKWRQHGAGLVAAARDRARPAPAAAPSPASSFFAALAALAKAVLPATLGYPTTLRDSPLLI